MVLIAISAVIFVNYISFDRTNAQTTGSSWDSTCAGNGGASVSEDANVPYTICWFATDVSSCTVKELNGNTDAVTSYDACTPGVNGEGPNSYGGHFILSKSVAGTYTYTVSAVSTNGNIIANAVADVVNVVVPGNNNNGATGCAITASGHPCFDLFKISKISTNTSTSNQSASPSNQPSSGSSTNPFIKEVRP